MLERERKKSKIFSISTVSQNTLEIIKKKIHGLWQDIIFIAPAYSRVRYRSPNFCPYVRPFVRPSTSTSKFGFLDINDSCESQTLHSNCP